MTAKEKAESLINTFYCILPNNGSQTGLNSTTSRYKEGVICALKAVDEIIIALEEHKWQNQKIIDYYQQVKQEIESYEK
jgi:hypothetical protein